MQPSLAKKMKCLTSNEVKSVLTVPISSLVSRRDSIACIGCRVLLSESLAAKGFCMSHRDFSVSDGVLNASQVMLTENQVAKVKLETAVVPSKKDGNKKGSSTRCPLHSLVPRVCHKEIMSEITAKHRRSIILDEAAVLAEVERYCRAYGTCNHVREKIIDSFYFLCDRDETDGDEDGEACGHPPFPMKFLDDGDTLEIPWDDRSFMEALLDAGEHEMMHCSRASLKPNRHGDDEHCCQCITDPGQTDQWAMTCLGMAVSRKLIGVWRELQQLKQLEMLVNELAAVEVLRQLDYEWATKELMSGGELLGGSGSGGGGGSNSGNGSGGGNGPPAMSASKKKKTNAAAKKAKKEKKEQEAQAAQAAGALKAAECSGGGGGGGGDQGGAGNGSGVKGVAGGDSGEGGASPDGNSSSGGNGGSGGVDLSSKQSAKSLAGGKKQQKQQQQSSQQSAHGQQKVGSTKGGGGTQPTAEPPVEEGEGLKEEAFLRGLGWTPENNGMDIFGSLGGSSMLGGLLADGLVDDIDNVEPLTEEEIKAAMSSNAKLAAKVGVK